MIKIKIYIYYLIFIKNQNQKNKKLIFNYINYVHNLKHLMVNNIY